MTSGILLAWKIYPVSDPSYLSPSCVSALPSAILPITLTSTSWVRFRSSNTLRIPLSPVPPVSPLFISITASATVFVFPPAPNPASNSIPWKLTPDPIPLFLCGVVSAPAFPVASTLTYGLNTLSAVHVPVQLAIVTDLPPVDYATLPLWFPPSVSGTAPVTYTLVPIAPTPVIYVTAPPPQSHPPQLLPLLGGFIFSAPAIPPLASTAADTA